MINLNKIIIFITMTLLSKNLISHTNKTYLKERPTSVNLARESTTFYELLQIKNDYRKYGNLEETKENPFKTSIQVIPFYSLSTNKTDLGKYFGTKNSNSIAFKENPDNTQINIQLIVHNSNAGAEKYSTTIALSPKQEIIGLTLNLHRDLDAFLDGLYFKVNTTIAHLKNNMQIKTIQENIDLASNYTSGILIDYFSGIYEKEANAEDSQKALTHAKINGKRTETAVADIDLILGYNIIEQEDNYLKINAGLTLPTGNEPKGEFLFEPVCGNARHWAIGGGLDFTSVFWSNENNEQNLKINVTANYRYLFRSTEKRTLGIKNFDYGHYYAIGQQGDTFATPAANILTQEVRVKPKSQLDAICMFTFNNENFTANLGYNFFWKASESIVLKKWNNEKYGIINPIKSFEEQDALDKTTNDDWFGGNFDAAKINEDRLDLETASTPSYKTHKIYGGIGYIFRDAKTPVMLGLGTSYEFAPENNEIEYFSIWGKLGVSF